MADKDDTSSQAADSVDIQRLKADLLAIAKPRPPGSTHHEVVRNLCSQRLADLGYEVERHAYGSGVNVIGRRRGTDRSRGALVVSAHYDSTPGCPGADDNASGVAGVLEAARLLAKTPFAADLILACWDEEESGLIGSWAYAERSAKRGDRIDLAISLEMIGYASDQPRSQQIPSGFDKLFPGAVAQIIADEYRGRFIAFATDPAAAPAVARLAQAADALQLPQVVLEIPRALLTSPLTGDLRRSDHTSFWVRGYPAVMVTDTANFRNPHYHCGGGSDAPADIDYQFLRRVVAATVTGVAQLAS